MHAHIGAYPTVRNNASTLFDSLRLPAELSLPLPCLPLLRRSPTPTGSSWHELKENAIIIRTSSGNELIVAGCVHR